ncbi:hypothetical protein WKK05_37970 (plasmid) [Nostoc sp. UHCC 0302]|uniref:hypothetical protein n=1 Tax=Nostoc sp. UHCC 0302 TaxID=3134896 RepID=UPI00311CA27B
MFYAKVTKTLETAVTQESSASINTITHVTQPDTWQPMVYICPSAAYHHRPE